MFIATLTLNKEKHEGKGKTAFEAIQNLNLDWNDIKTKGTIELVKKEGRGKGVKTKTAKKLLFLRDLRRAVSSKFGIQRWAKNLEYLLKDK